MIRSTGWRTPTVVLICGGLILMLALAFLGHQLGALIGAWAGGAIFDATGSYQLVWLASIALSLIAATLCMPIDERALARPALGAAP